MEVLRWEMGAPAGISPATLMGGIHAYVYLTHGAFVLSTLSNLDIKERRENKGL